MTSNQIVESDEENIEEFTISTAQQNWLSIPELTNEMESGDCFQKQQSKNCVVVEVYEFPDKSLEELLDELVFHFSIEPFNADTLTCHADIYDEKSKTFKLEFSKSDAEVILQTKEQSLLGEENEKIKLRLFEPQKPCAVLLTCEVKIASEKVIRTGMNKFGQVKEVRKMDNTAKKYLVIFDKQEDAARAADTGGITLSGKHMTLSLWNEAFDDSEQRTDQSSAYCGENFSQGLEESALRASDGIAKCVKYEHTNTSRTELAELEDDQNNSTDIPSVAVLSESSVLLVSNLCDIDNLLMAHWIKTVTGIQPLSCHMNENQEKAIVKMPSAIDKSMFDKVREKEYFIHGSRLHISMLQQTKSLLIELNGGLLHKDVIKLYFNSKDSGVKNGQITAIRQLNDNCNVFVLTFDDHRAIHEITQRAIHTCMDHTIEVAEFYAEAGHCRPRDCFVFSSREHEAQPEINVARLVVKDVSISERKQFELLMKNNRLSEGDKSAKITVCDSVACVSYDDHKVTLAVFDKSRKDGIFLNDKRLEMDLETTELTSIHDHKAVRLSGLPQNIDPDRLKFYLSDISGNLVTSMLFKENGDRAVAYFKDNIDMRLLYSNYRSIKLEDWVNGRLQPELKSTSVMISSLTSELNQNYLELQVEDILSHAHSATVENLNDGKSVWIVNVCPEDIEILCKELSKESVMTVSKYSEFLGANVTNGIHTRIFLLSKIVEDQFLLQFLLDNMLSGYKRLLTLIQENDCELCDDGSVTMKFDSQLYRECTNKWNKLKRIITSEIPILWCVNRTISLPEEISHEFHSMLWLTTNTAKIYFSEDNLIIAGEKKQVQETALIVSRAIKEMVEKSKEEKETRKEKITLSDYEVAYLNISNVLCDLSRRFHVKELSVDINQSCLIIHANNKHFDDIKKEIMNITSSLCEASVRKSELFIKKCESEICRGKILEKLKALNLKAVCVPSKNRLSAYAKTKGLAHLALKCIDEVVWETIYPEGRDFNEEEKSFLRQNQHLWQKAKRDIMKKYSSVDIIENLNETNVVVTGCGQDYRNCILEEICTFFSKCLKKSTVFSGNKFHIDYIIRYRKSEMKLIEQITKATVTVEKERICLFGTDEQITEAEQKLKELDKKIRSAKHKVEGNYLVKFLLSEEEIIEDIGNANQTLIILENGDRLRQQDFESSKARDELVLQINISERTTLQVRKTEIHEIKDCDGLTIPTSRNLKLDDLNPLFANYVKDKGGIEIFNECINSPKALKGGGKLLPGSHLTTTAGKFTSLKTIIHMVLEESSNTETALQVLERSIRNAFVCTKEQGLMALLIPMSSFPDSYDYNLVIRTVIKTIKGTGDILPRMLVLLESRSSKLTDLRNSLNGEFQSIRNDLRPVARKLASASTASTHKAKKLSRNELLIGGCKFTIVKGLLQDSKQQVIVNSTGKTINLQDTPLGKALSDAAGPQLQVECTSLAPLNEGEVKVTNAYNLQCKSILHCKLNAYHNINQLEKDLTEFIKKCLRIADQSLKYQSVGFPALGTGNLQYPASVVADCFINALIEYTSKGTVRHLSEVVVVIYPADIQIYQAFLDAIEQYAGPTPNERNILQRQELPTPIASKEFQIKKSDTSFSLNNTKISIHLGDILHYSGKAIVCPTDKKLHMGGSVAKRLMKDPYIFEKLGNVSAEDMLSDGLCFVRTLSGKVALPNYKAEYIFLIDSYSQMDSVVKICLEKCQKKGIDSIALPFIGAGVRNRGEPPKEMAAELLMAAVDFLKNNGKGPLKNIDFVIFEQSQFQIFEAALKDLNNTPSLFGLMKGAFNYLLGFNNAGKSRARDSYMPPDEETQVLDMVIYGVEDADIELTKTKLNDKLKRETVVIQWDKLDSYEKDKSLIARLSPDQVTFLSEEAKRLNVDLILELELSNIQITGCKSTIFDYRDIIKNMLRDIEKNDLDRKFEEYDSNNIIWKYRDKPEEEWSSFKWEDSHSIESIHQQNPNGMAEIESKEFKEVLKIDLHKKTFKFQGKKFSVRRFDKTSDFPAGWDESAGDLAVVKLDKKSTEYQIVETNFKLTINHPSAVIIEISRVQHLTAYKQYIEQRRLVAKKLIKPEDGVELVPLWHGSHETTVHKISKSFFNRSYAGLNATSFGKGSYFARNASYSAQERYSKMNPAGEKHMIQARVVVGDYAVGNPNMIDCPLKTDGTSFDSVVDDVQNPTIFVVFHDAAAYPEYIIKFKL